MKKVLISLMLVAVPSIALAAERVDNSMYLVYGFLFMCGMIIMLQCVPLIILVWGMIKGLFSKSYVLKKHENKK